MIVIRGMHLNHRKMNPHADPRERKMATAITDQDVGHMNAFPVKKKVKIIQDIMSKSPVEEWNLEGNTSYIKTILRLRASGLELIDLQPQETVFTTVWYSRNRSLLGRVKSEVAAMLMWESNGHDGGITTLRVWHI